MAISARDSFGTNIGNFASYLGKSGISSTAFNLSGPVQDWAKNAFNTPNLLSGDIIDRYGLAAPAGFTFITAPQDISYSQNSDVKTISMFGTNEPPVTVGQTNMKKLQLGNAMMEGFIVGKSVQRPIDELFAMMNVELRNGFVNVPVYSVNAEQKSYSAREGGWIIESVTIKEELRDLKGNLTRAIVDVELQEVGSYQINKGVDQANQPTAPPKGEPPKVNQAPAQEARVATANRTRTTPARRPATAPTPRATAPRVTDRAPTTSNRNYAVGGIEYDWRTGLPVRR